MVDFVEIPDGETWELFARDFLEAYGFYIQSHPSRGADGGKDLLVVEKLRGRLGNYQLKWLVSCKHYAKSGKSVTETDEPNILERVKSFGADGFIGFYSTLPSSGFAARLESLRTTGDIKDFRIFDGKYVENNLVTGSYSHLLLSYLPKSYQRLKPIHLVCDTYEPLLCEVCKKDILLELYKDGKGGNIIYAKNTTSRQIENVYCVCLGSCDRYLEKKLFATRRLITAWHSLSDALIPANYLRFVISVMNGLKKDVNKYTDEAYEQEKDIIIKISQRVLRFTNNQEMDRVRTLVSLPPYL